MLDASRVVHVLGSHLLQSFPLVHLFDRLLEVLQAKNENSDIVKRATCCAFSQDDFYSFSRGYVLIVMELLSAVAADLTLRSSLRRVVWRQVIRCLRRYLLFDSAPDSIHALLIVKSFENSIATNHEEIEVIFQFETAYLRVAHDHILVSTVLLFLSLYVTESSGDGEATWEHPERTLHIQILLVWACRRFGKRLGAIDFSTGGLDTYPFLFIVWLMVTSQYSDLRARVNRHYATAITNVDHIGHVVYNHDNGCAATRALWADTLSWHSVLSPSLSYFNQVKKTALAFFETSHDCLLRKLWKVVILHDEIVKIVTKVVCACGSAMAIKDAKEADLWPFDLQILLAFRLQNVQDD